MKYETSILTRCACDLCCPVLLDHVNTGAGHSGNRVHAHSTIHSESDKRVVQGIENHVARQIGFLYRLAHDGILF